MALIRSRIARVALVLLLALSTVASAQQQQRGACLVRVTLLQVNDVYQFVPVERGREGGLARVSTLRKEIIKESPHTLFLLAGDTISPSVESITYKGAQMIDAWNQIGLDYSVFGNHEFDFGPDVLLERIRESKFGWLGANVYDTRTGKLFGDTPPYVVREFEGVKVGLFGIVLPETKTTSSPGPNVEFRGACETARQIVSRLESEGVRTIVALTHLSLREDKELARCAPGIDIIIGGHEHTLLQSSSSGTPVFKMAADARQLGRFDLNIDPRTGEVESIDWQVIPVGEGVAEDAAFAPVLAKYGAKLRELSTVVGRTEVALDARSVENRTVETNIADFIADSFRAATRADVALVNGGSIRADAIISAGDITLRDVLSILPFNNELSKIEITGETLLLALEHGVSRTAPGAEPGRFPQVSGIRFVYDASRLPGTRIGEVTINGQPLDPKRKYTLVTSRYVAEGGDQYEMFKGHPNLLSEKLIDSEVLRRRIASARTIAPKTDGRIRRADAPQGEKPCQPVPPLPTAQPATTPAAPRVAAAGRGC
jgi:5'-nucleotidase